MRLLATLLSASLVAGCAGSFGGPVSRSTKISEGSRITATSIVPHDTELRGVIEQLALAEEIYAKQLDALRDRRNSLRTRKRSLTLASYATFAATTIVISAAAIASSSGEETMTTGQRDGLKTAGYGALGGLGVGTTLEVVNLMQEDPASLEAKIRHLQASYDNMVQRLRELFESTPVIATRRPSPTPGAPGEPVQLPPPDAATQSIEIRAIPIIEAFINEALQISVKG
ncbi:MAG: hypothetical protein ABI867_20515 [Kofleriaceae bacterium]